MRETTRVAVADNSAAVRAGLRLLLKSKPEFEYLGESGAGEEAVRTMMQNRPDVLMLGVRVLDERFFKSLARTTAKYSRCRVLILTSHDDPAYARRALAAGARGYLLKETVDVELIPAIEALVAGKRYIDPSLTSRLYREEHVRLW